MFFQHSDRLHKSLPLFRKMESISPKFTANKKPVQKNLLRLFCFTYAAPRQNLRSVFDVVYDVANSLDVFQIFVSNLDTEFFLNGHYQIYQI